MITSIDRVQELVKNINTFGSNSTRVEAAKELGRLGVYNKVVIDSLQKGAREHYYDFQKACLEALEEIYLKKNIKKTSKNIFSTDIKLTFFNDQKLECENTNVFCKCYFCEKETKILKEKTVFSLRDKFYCTFCLRNKHYQKDSKNILITSFRGIIGYYYYAFHYLPKNAYIFISEIWDYIHLHQEIGLKNPIFYYDPDSFLWFIDFNRVGKTNKKIPIEKVLTTINEILLCFNLFELIRDIQPHKLYLKYEEAILKFYHQRQRPEDMKILSPSLIKTGACETIIEKPASFYNFYQSTYYNSEKKRIPMEETKFFMPNILNEEIGKKT